MKGAVTPRMFDLTGCVAIVTGGGKGIGAEAARVLAAAGADVVVGGRHPETLEIVAANIRTLGRRALSIPTDMRSVADVRSLVSQTLHAFGRIDVLVNNAGVNRTGPTLEVTEETWDSILDTNVKGMFFACQAVGPAMITARRGKIINIGSIISAIGLGYNIPYAASKGAVLQLTRSLALEWASHNIQVNAIGPGYVMTDQVRWLFENPEFARKILAKQPSGRIGEVQDLDGAILFLASAASDYLNGQMIFVDGASATGWMGPE
jgi:NAD(P)-dependent dehydrogenase (short-subunit alcohol dehydrogenase family)